MNKKTTIAFEFFNSIESSSEYNFGEIFTLFSEEKLVGGQNSYRSIKYEITKYFDYLYGLKETFPIFVQWVVEYKKIDIPNNSIFRFLDKEWMRIQGLTWTEIVSRPDVRKSIEWVYKDKQLVEIDN
jgi:hypothetical protein